MKKGRIALIAASLLLVTLLVVSIASCSSGGKVKVEGDKNLPTVTVGKDEYKVYQNKKESGALKYDVSCPITGDKKLDEAMKELVDTATKSFLAKATGDAAKDSKAEELTTNFEILGKTDADFTVLFISKATHCGVDTYTEATIKFDRKSGAQLEVSDNILPPLRDPAVQPTGAPNTSGKKRIAFTFDDGPANSTELLLDGLKKRNIKVTFFLLGEQISQFPETVKRAYAEGHILGNHSYNHANLFKLDGAAIVKQIDDTDAQLTKLGLPKSTYFRPPYGNLSKNDAPLVEKPVIIWSIDPLDWEKKNRNAENVRRNIVSQASDGAIVLVHDIYKTSVEGALLAMDDLRAAGYDIVNLPDLLFSSEKPVMGQKYFEAKKAAAKPAA